MNSIGYCSCVEQNHNSRRVVQNLYYYFARCGWDMAGLEMREGQTENRLLKEYGYPDHLIKEIWKWYDSSKKKGLLVFEIFPIDEDFSGISTLTAENSANDLNMTFTGAS